MSLRSTFKQHVSDEANPFIDFSTKIQQKVSSIQAELEKINKSISTNMVEFKSSGSESRKNELKKRIVFLFRRKKLYEKQLTYYNSQLFNIDQLTFSAQTEETLFHSEENAPLTRSNLKSVTLEGDDISKYDQNLLTKEINSINDMISELDPLPSRDDEFQLAFDSLSKEFLTAEIPLSDYLTEFDDTMLSK
ncbi:hypothetical protein M9Y10_028466 [Tritrichomonas musculus]|uniref:Uncharacterized protein n=1 Tax=Tritrichomonas musculus TaxID=1915356 RepID=A0ABR2KJL9_9EUKA